MTANDKLQKGFSAIHGSTIFDAGTRAKKAAKALSIIEDAYPHMAKLDVLDIGCAAGIGTRVYAEHFHHVVGIDIDEPAVRHAARHNRSSNIDYLVMDSQHIAFPDGSFDMIICTHVYEHVPDAHQLMSEIYRLLKAGGACYFTAGNRISLIEPHYRLPLLSVLPKTLAHIYLRVLNRGNFYYETHLTYWGLKKLVSKFEVIDYTVKAVKDPVRFSASDVIVPGSSKQKISLILLRLAYWLCPTYIWLLKKAG
jgi:2-polyprenyl-3-methyl-5-hydroxy-6-metoxy-1,4-benzoquinol methylase